MLVVLCVRNITVFEMLLMKANTLIHTYICNTHVCMYFCFGLLNTFCQYFANFTIEVVKKASESELSARLRCKLLLLLTRQLFIQH